MSKEQVRQVYAAVLESRISPMLRPEQIEPLIERARQAFTSTRLEGFRQMLTKYNYAKLEGPVTVPEPKNYSVT